MLIVFSGLPGTGKTTIAKLLAKELAALYLRIDTIENSLAKKYIKKTDMKDAGYAVAYALAKENLDLGLYVIADCVNPIQITREAWYQTAKKSKVPCLEIELICSDKAEHQRRIENRTSDLSEFVLPVWSQVVNRQYEPYTKKHLIYDTAFMSAEQIKELILKHINVLMVHNVKHL